MLSLVLPPVLSVLVRGPVIVLDDLGEELGVEVAPAVVAVAASVATAEDDVRGQVGAGGGVYRGTGRPKVVLAKVHLQRTNVDLYVHTQAGGRKQQKGIKNRR